MASIVNGIEFTSFARFPSIKMKFLGEFRPSEEHFCFHPAEVETVSQWEL